MHAVCAAVVPEGCSSHFYIFDHDSGSLNSYQTCYTKLDVRNHLSFLSQAGLKRKFWLLDRPQAVSQRLNNRQSQGQLVTEHRE